MSKNVAGENTVSKQDFELEVDFLDLDEVGAIPETTASSGTSSCSATSTCGSSSCCGSC
ncbi:thiazolylpeptide-type bacteriocin [Oceanobacillus piezotolerans]|uniref:Thiazolylpeptide-type bacteriocin n=1 Tax=Oceanobacillus piezotolerans TaxID=2448030 RepID=A0A498DFV1_9BACI|nr:thiazolylpeptide-type bacteriocin [Oceanobacillus piezotolerans]RLL42878.1 thiazolylpeptide-type bacteriocin [Oceanobacillus piezotolerans]